jgi:hypothetical protein
MELNGRLLTTSYPNTSDLHFPFGKSSPVVTLAMRRTPRGPILATFGIGLIRAVTPPNGQRLAAEFKISFQLHKVCTIHTTMDSLYRRMWIQINVILGQSILNYTLQWHSSVKGTLSILDASD